MRLLFLSWVAVFFCCSSGTGLWGQNDTLKRFSTGLTGSLAKGNLELISIIPDFMGYYPGKVIGVRARYNSIHQWLNNNRIENDYYAAVLPLIYPNAPVYGFGLLRYEQSQRRKIARRFQFGAGIGRNFIRTAHHQMQGRAGVVSDEVFYPADSLPYWGKLQNRRRQLGRFSVLLSGHHVIFEKKVDLAYEAWFQPAFTRLADMRFQLDFTLDTQLAKRLFIRLKIFYFYEAWLVKGVKPGDLRSSIGFGYKLN